MEGSASAGPPATVAPDERLRNLLAKLPERERERVRLAYWQALDDATGERDAKQRLGALVDELDGAGYTAAATCLADDLDALVVHLRYPTRHRRRWRSTNLLERSLAEVKRRTKVIGRFPGETSCLTLVWAVLDLYITHAKTASDSASSNANASSGSDTKAVNKRLPRRRAPLRLSHREPKPRRIYSSQETPPLRLQTLARRAKRESRLGAGSDSVADSDLARSAASPDQGAAGRAQVDSPELADRGARAAALRQPPSDAPVGELAP
jgi:hypothetical protein